MKKVIILKFYNRNNKLVRTENISANKLDVSKIGELLKEDEVYVECIISYFKEDKKEFTADELIILKNIDKKWNYIARDKNENALFVYDYKPFKNDEEWGVETFKGECFEISIFSNLFKTITWEDEEPVRIDDYIDRGEW